MLQMQHLLLLLALFVYHDVGIDACERWTREVSPYRDDGDEDTEDYTNDVDYNDDDAELVILVWKGNLSVIFDLLKHIVFKDSHIHTQMFTYACIYLHVYTRIQTYFKHTHTYTPIFIYIYVTACV